MNKYVVGMSDDMVMYVEAHSYGIDVHGFLHFYVIPDMEKRNTSEVASFKDWTNVNLMKEDE